MIDLSRPLVAIDIESTGTDPQKDRIVELSLVFWLPGRDEPVVKTRRLNPGVPIPAEATAVHGITDADVAGCPTFRQIGNDLLLQLDGCDLVGFNIRAFDLPMLAAECERHGFRFDHEGRHILDAMSLFHLHEPRNLEAAVLFYLGRPHEGAHGAEADATAAVDVLVAQVERYGLDASPAALHALCDEHRRYETEVDRWWDTTVGDDPKLWPFRRGKHKGTELGRTPRDYLSWMVNVADDMPADVRKVAKDMMLGRFG